MYQRVMVGAVAMLFSAMVWADVSTGLPVTSGAKSVDCAKPVVKKVKHKYKHRKHRIHVVHNRPLVSATVYVIGPPGPAGATGATGQQGQRGTDGRNVFVAQPTNNSAAIVAVPGPQGPDGITPDDAVLHPNRPKAHGPRD